MPVAAVVPGAAGRDLGEQDSAARRHPLLRRQRAHGEKKIALNGVENASETARETRSLIMISKRALAKAKCEPGFELLW